MIGQTISHYKILEKLGEGGMGVVYKAHDTKLDRDVALKFLPRDISPSGEERTRFIHEAKAASALEHPVICTIHEIGETPDGQMYIVMGYYEGMSLNKKVEKGPLDVAEAVSITMQIADGLQAAHEKGIVHRDIKSNNIIVSDKGQVRILDFGLARRKGLSKLTKTGTTVGTASYMSPEQAQGESIDHRTDIWSLGIVLYEMVTGRLPFRGEHEAAILYSVVNEEPQPLEVTISSSSPELIHIVGRALEKNVVDRYQSVAEMLVDLKRLKKETSRTGFSSVSGARKSVPWFRKKAPVVALTMVLLVVAGYLVLMKKGMGLNPDVTQHTLPIPFKEVGYNGISGDGNWIGFSAKDREGAWGLYLWNLNGGEPRIVTTGLDENTGVDVSVDGSLLLYIQWNSQSAKMDLNVTYTNGGTPPRRIMRFAGNYARFRPDKQRIGYIVNQGIPDPSPSDKNEFWSVGIDGTDPRREFIDSASQWGGSTSFSYSQDSRKVAWLRSFPEKYQEIIIYDLQTGQEKAITSAKKKIDELAWVREDKILYTTEKGGIYNIWLISASGGEPVQVTNGTEPVVGIKASADGQKIIYLQKRPVTDLWVVNLAENRPHQITFNDENQYQPEFSPDGKKVAFILGGPENQLVIEGGYNINPSHLYIMDRDGGNRTQLSFGEEVVWGLEWSPDGRRIAYGSRKLSEPVDSFRTYVIEPSNPGSSKYTAQGTPEAWLDSARFQVRVHNTVYLTSIERAPLTQVYDDSTRAFYILSGKYIVYRDLRQGKDPRQWWFVDGIKPREVQRKTARLFPWTQGFLDRGFLYTKNKGELWRLTGPSSKPERVRADFLGANDGLSPSWDGKAMIIVKHRPSAKIVMIENLFR